MKIQTHSAHTHQRTELRVEEGVFAQGLQCDYSAGDKS